MRYLLQDVFLDSVVKYPNNIAVWQESKRYITYKDLDKLSNQFAHVFLKNKKNVREQPYVGILSYVNINSIAAVLGALKIGCSYVPLDENSPADRLQQIVDNTDLDVIVVDSKLYSRHKDFLNNNFSKTIIFLDDFKVILNASDLGLEKLNQVSDDLAYILHSSGSTGVPKGIMLTHRNACTFIDWMHREFKLKQNDVVMSRAPFKFDLSIFDIFNTLKAGAKLICYDWSKNRSQVNKHSDYVELMENQCATILYTTPSTFISLMNRGQLGNAKLSLRQIMYAGEPFPIPQLRRLREMLPKVGMANIYGPTETNIITCYWIDKLSKKDKDVPLGHVVDDTEILIVSKDGKRICNVGEVGELWCRGGTVTVGYLGMPEKTNENLVQSPFHRYPAKFWKTGDFGYLDKSGLLHYCGRRDHMIKVKGFRIEIGDIESALAVNSNLDEFCVVSVPDEKYGNRLYCFYSLLKYIEDHKTNVKTSVSKIIPDYMIPYDFVYKECMPKNSAGKVDRICLFQEAKRLLAGV